MDDKILKEIAEQYNTPSYVFDTDALTSRIQWIKNILGDRVKICYAMKANPFLLQAASLVSDSFEVCSPGEYAICERMGISPEKIVLSGVNKEEKDIEAVILQRGAGTYTAESLNQLKLLELCAQKAATSLLPVLLRVSSGNQFGMDEDSIFSVMSEINNYPHLDIKGLQYYSGTQKKKKEYVFREIQYLDSLCLRLLEEYGFEVRELEYGPGFYIPYFEGEQLADENELLKEFKKELEAMNYKGSVTLEMGRFLAAPCGSYLTRIADIKTNQGQNYCIIDGGINHINYYGQAMAMKIPPYRFLPASSPEFDTDLETAPWTVCGSLCTVGDVLVKNLPLAGVKQGDLLVFDRIGAYSVTEGIYLFLSRKLPRVIYYTSGEGSRLVREAVSTDCLNSPMYEINRGTTFKNT